MIEAVIRDITRPGTEVVVSAANGVGIMGRGVAGAISQVAGQSIIDEAKALIKHRGKIFQTGEIYITGPGKMSRRGVRKIYHAVTMQYPGGLTSVNIVNILMHKLLKGAIKGKRESIAIPGLGTGIGRLDRNIVANVMVGVAKQYDHKIKIRILDQGDDFINEVKHLIG